MVAKPRVSVEVDGDWLNGIVQKAVENGLRDVEYQISEQVEDKVSQAVERALSKQLAAAAKRAIKEQLGA